MVALYPAVHWLTIHPSTIDCRTDILLPNKTPGDLNIDSWTKTRQSHHLIFPRVLLRKYLNLYGRSSKEQVNVVLFFCYWHGYFL